jgi:hypothetical protein
MRFYIEVQISISFKFVLAYLQFLESRFKLVEPKYLGSIQHEMRAYHSTHKNYERSSFYLTINLNTELKWNFFRQQALHAYITALDLTRKYK